MLQGSAAPGPAGAASSSEVDTDTIRPVAKVGCSAVLHSGSLARKAAQVYLPAKPARICRASALHAATPADQFQHVACRLRLLHLFPCHCQRSLTLTLSSLFMQVLGSVKVSQLRRAVPRGTEGDLLQQVTQELGRPLDSEQSRRWQLQVALMASKSEVGLLCRPVRTM